MDNTLPFPIDQSVSIPSKPISVDLSDIEILQQQAILWVKPGGLLLHRDQLDDVLHPIETSLRCDIVLPKQAQPEQVSVKVFMRLPDQYSLGCILMGPIGQMLSDKIRMLLAQSKISQFSD